MPQILSSTRRGVLAGAACALLAPRPAHAADQGYAVWSSLALVDQAGVGFQLGDRGRPLTFVNLWAHWCSACLSEMPSLEGLAAKLPIDIVLLSHPDNWARDQDAAARRRLPFRLATLSPANPLWVRQAVFEVVPRSVVYRRQEQAVVLAHQGADRWDSPANLRRITGLLAA